MGAKSKRTEGVSSDQPYGVAAHRIVQAALKEVQHWLPLAAERRCADDGENVHRLRVSTRRASVALSAFKDLIDRTKSDALREELRQIRKAADIARNVDATADHFFSHCGKAGEALCGDLRKRLSALRQEAQAPIVAMHQNLFETEFEKRIHAVLADMLEHTAKRAKQTFGKRARVVLKPALKKFFKAAKCDVSVDAELHHLRIQGKKLRYTMEIVGIAFPPSFSGKLYRQFCDFQDLMGAVRDRLIMQDMLREWLAKPCADDERAFFQHLLNIEQTEYRDALKKFTHVWTKKNVRKLKHDFDSYTSRA